MDAKTEELLAKFRSGDEAAYGILFQRYLQPVKAFLRGHMDTGLRRHVSEDDLLQETHIEALKSLDKFTYRRELAFFFWLCGIARHRIQHHCRRLKRRPPPLNFAAPAKAAETLSQDLINTIRGVDPSPSQQVSLREHLGLMAAALDSLPATSREAVVLRYIEGHENADAARIAGVKPDTFRVRLSRGLVLLREAFVKLLGGIETGTEKPPP
jgi:RNA polymerase sigma-70 factor (ECF subfamily)